MNLSCSPAVIASRVDVNSPRVVNIIQPYGSVQDQYPWIWRLDHAHHPRTEHEGVHDQLIGQDTVQDERTTHQDVPHQDIAPPEVHIRHLANDDANAHQHEGSHNSFIGPQLVHSQIVDRSVRQDNIVRPEITRPCMPRIVDDDHTEPLLQDQDNESILARPQNERIRLIRTISMLLIYICLGLNAGILSPATLDLMDLYQCNVEQISMVFMVKSIGLLFGSFCGGIISNRFRRKADVFLACIIIVFGATNAALPWCPDPWIAGLLMGVVGLMHGTINVVCSSVTIAEWGEAAPAPVNAIHFALTLGMMLAPPTTAPFLSRRDDNTTLNILGHSENDPVNNVHPWSSHLTPLHHNSSIFPVHESISDLGNDMLTSNSSAPTGSRIFIPFTLHGALSVCAGLLFLAYYFAGWEYRTAKHSGSPSGENSSTMSTRVGRRFKIAMGISLFFIYVCIVNSNNTINVFIFYVAVKSSIRMSKSRAAMFNTVYNSSWVIGRLMGTINARFIKIHYIVFFSICAVLANTTLLVFYGFHSEVTFWCLTCAMGIFSGPCYPCVMAWADRYIEMEGVMVAMIDVGIGLGGFISLYLGGYLLHTRGSVYIFIMSAAASLMLFISMVTLQIYCHIRGDRYKIQPLQYSPIENYNKSEDED